MKNMKLVLAALTVMTFTFMGTAHANDTGMAAIEVIGINPHAAVTGNNDLSVNFGGESVRPFMNVLPPMTSFDGPDYGKHNRSLVVVSRLYYMQLTCKDAEYNAMEGTWKKSDLACSIAVRANYSSYNPDFGDLQTWDPESRLETPLLSGAGFDKTSELRTFEFYGKESAKFLNILPPGGKLKITGAGSAVDISCQYGTYTRANGHTEKGVTCKIAQQAL